MALEPYQVRLLELYVKQEESLAAIYGLLAASLPDHAEFFNAMTEDERRHAAYLNKLKTLSESGEASFSEGRIKTYTLKAFLDYQEKIAAEIKAKGCDLKRAMAIMMDLEGSLIEKEAFSHFESKKPDVQSTLVRVRDESFNHFVKARTYASAHRSK